VARCPKPYPTRQSWSAVGPPMVCLHPTRPRIPYRAGLARRHRCSVTTAVRNSCSGATPLPPGPPAITPGRLFLAFFHWAISRFSGTTMPRVLLLGRMCTCDVLNQLDARLPKSAVRPYAHNDRRVMVVLNLGTTRDSENVTL